ncbi:hypothetical protein KY311_02170 [Candidatus Woesearchaeota archaeon]|nr:hypothetical protein [Candidatus Woesearchaeota archaeon]MBW3016755.1 hypothetical protein [Candidatus Woesearchaeota archaeon]
MKKAIIIIALLVFVIACEVQEPVGEPPQKINFEGNTYVATGAVLEDASVIEDSGYDAQGYTIFVDKRDETHFAVFIYSNGKYYIWLKEEGFPPQAPQ